VGDPTVFARDHWGVTPMLRRGAGSFRDLLGVDVVEQLVAAPARRPMIRLVRGGSPVPFGEYGASLRLGGVLVDDVVDVSRVMQSVAGGATVVLQSLQHSWPPIGRFCEALQREMGHAVQANCYLTPPGSTALARHRDTHEVLVVQIEGSKVWEVDGLGAFALEPGDVAYIPRGTAHEAAAQSGLSLHLTIGLLASTYRTVLHRVVDDLPAELDRPMPLSVASRPGQAAGEARLAAALATLAAVDAADAVGRQIRSNRTRRRVVPMGHLRAVLQDRDIDECTWIRLDPRLDTKVEGDRLVLSVGARRLAVPLGVAPVVESLIGAGPVAVGALTGLDPESRIVLARRLVRETFAYVVERPSESPDSVLRSSG
jgi:mannose-6-phosphate isomerase-like protein (cupin superfamily)